GELDHRPRAVERPGLCGGLDRARRERRGARLRADLVDPGEAVQEAAQRRVRDRDLEQVGKDRHSDNVPFACQAIGLRRLRRSPFGDVTMCFEFDAEPPALPPEFAPIAGGAAAELLELTSADGTRFSAALAEAAQGSDPAVVILPDVRGLYRFYVEL